MSDARDKLGELKMMNRGRFDWDKEKQEREKAKVKAMTLSEWLDRYLELVNKKEPKPSQCAHL